MTKWIGMLTLALFSAAAVIAQAPAGKDLGWAFPTAAMVVNKPPMPEKEFEGQLTIPGTGKSFTMPQLEDLTAPPDWFSAEHPPAPRVVTDGTVNKGFACGSCHLMNGLGHPESGDVQGLTPEYFIQTMKDFKSGKRKDPIRMTAIAQRDYDRLERLSTHQVSASAKSTPRRGARLPATPSGDVFLGSGSTGDADAAMAHLRSGGRLNQPRRHVRARDPMRKAPSASLGKDCNRAAGRFVGEPARVDDGPTQVALAERLLSGSLVLDAALVDFLR